MKMVQCSYDGCGDKRVHYENPEPRGARELISVPDDHQGPIYCSFECAMYDGAFNARTGWNTQRIEEKKREMGLWPSV